MNIPYYINYCVKCGEYNHLGKNCKNIDKDKLAFIEENHQTAFMTSLYGTFSLFCPNKNRVGDYECKKCGRTFREYKYYLYHEIHHSQHCKFSKLKKYQYNHLNHYKNVVVLK